MAAPFTRTHLTRLLHRLNGYAAPAWSAPPVITAPLLAGQVVGWSDGTATGYPQPTRTTQIIVNGTSVGAGPYTAQAGDSVVVRRTATNVLGSASVDSAAVIVQSNNTWAALQRLWLNVPALADWDKSQPFVDLVATAERGFRVYADPYNGAAVAVKANGQPAADFALILLDNVVDADVGYYLGGFSGQGTPQLDDTPGAIDQVVYSGGITTFRVRRDAVGAGSPRITLKFQGISADFGDTVPLYLLRVGVPRGTGQVWGADWDAHLAPAAGIRYMNWSGVNNSNDVGPAGALQFNATPYLFGRRLSTQIALSNHLNKHFWGNVPARSDAAYRNQYIGQVQSTLGAGLFGLIEFSNEPWNGGSFAAYNQMMAAMEAATQARSGPSAIVSVSRSGGVVTAVLAAAHGKAPGQTIGIAQVGNIGRGVYTLQAGSTGSTLVWNEAGGNASGNITGDSVIYLNPAHPACAPTATLPIADRYEAKENWDILQCRDIFDRIASAGGAARLRPALGIQLDYMARTPRMMQWANDVWGDCDWLTWCPAYYAFPQNQASLDTEQKVKDALDAARQVCMKQLWQFAFIARTFGANHVAVYEMGPHNHAKTTATQAAVKAVHESDWMRQFARAMFQDVANILQCVACWYEAGAVDTYGTVTDNTWPVAYPHISNYANAAKWKAVNETAQLSYQPVAVNGLTWGTLAFTDAVVWIYSQGAGNVIIGTVDRLPPGGLVFPVWADAAGSKTLTLAACGNFGGDKVDILVDGVEVAHQVALPNQNPYTEAASVAWSGVVSLAAGGHTVAVRLGATRGAQIGLRQLSIA